ncbi:acyl-CoA thioester hydrolase/BAAT C-terminal domain-containing protein [Streptococcus sp. H49]|uniref:acyl-CoA thioester hydrolase/BAAT C-terminal domain-containing protein n=1 Tax=Streptococcus huangxiaojuni TaxID=3237239 RepID=UPI0034A1A2E6
MKIFLRLLKYAAVLIVLFIAIIVVLRLYNHSVYNKYKQVDSSSIYSDPTNLDLYPSEYEGVQIEHIKGDYLNGFHLRPSKKTKKGVVVTFGGSEGSPGYYEGVSFALQGYEVLSLFSYGMPNQQPSLSKIPIDFFDEVLAYIEKNVADPAPLTLYGASKGAELCLNLVNYYSEIDHIILMAPSAYNFNGLDYENISSSWTYKGKELPYISTMHAGFPEYIAFLFGMVSGAPTSYEPLYRTAIANTDKAADYEILQEAADADILIFAGGDDRMWPSASMAKVIKKTQGERAELHIYDKAGHIFAEGGYLASPYGLIATGGSKKENEAAGQAYREVLMERLNQWHQ